MAPDSQTAGGLSADHGIRLGHLRGNILKAHVHLIALLPHILRHPVQQMGGGIVPDTGTRPAPVFQQIIVQQHQQRIGMQEDAVFINDPQAVRVAVGGDAKIAAVVHHIVGQHLQPLRAGGGHFSAEQGVVLLMDHVHVTAAGQQDGPQAALADAVHGVNGDAQPGPLDLLHVHHLKDAVDILVEGISLPDQALLHGLVIVHAAHLLRPQQGDLLLDLPGHALIRVPSALGEDLDAVVDGGIVAGGNGQAVGGLHLLDGEHDQRRRRGSGHHKDPEPITRQHLRCPVGGFLGQKAPVIAHADLLAGMSLQQHQPAQPRHHQADVFLGESVGDDGTPSAGSEMDHTVLLFLHRHFPGYPITTSTRATVPAGITGSFLTGFPSRVMAATPFSTPAGLDTCIWYSAPRHLRRTENSFQSPGTQGSTVRLSKSGRTPSRYSVAA